MNNLYNARRGGSSMGGSLQSFPRSVVRICLNIRIAVILSVIFTALGLCTAQGTEQSSQSAALAYESGNRKENRCPKRFLVCVVCLPS